jgi:poly-beta-1,6-N-acetyl-D-glucosamine synthase
MNCCSYIIITPVRNEQEHILQTIHSVTVQTLKPREWIIVDDGSSDCTPELAMEAANAHAWIKVIRRLDRGYRKPGTGVMEAFREGLAAVQTKDWQFLVKLDGDLSFCPDYFERCAAHFEWDRRLGIGGGTVCVSNQGQLVEETPNDPHFHVRGASKIYRRECWEAIGGLIESTGWDTLDEVRANMLGWVTYRFPKLKLQHHKPTGSADGTWEDSFKNGRANYIAGYHPLFMFAKCMKRLFSRPYLVGAGGLACGFLTGYLKSIAQVNDRALISFLRKEQLKYLFFQDSIWRSAEYKAKTVAGAAPRQT